MEHTLAIHCILFYPTGMTALMLASTSSWHFLCTPVNFYFTGKHLILIGASIQYSSKGIRIEFLYVYLSVGKLCVLNVAEIQLSVCMGSLHAFAKDFPMVPTEIGEGRWPWWPPLLALL